MEYIIIFITIASFVILYFFIKNALVNFSKEFRGEAKQDRIDQLEKASDEKSEMTGTFIKQQKDVDEKLKDVVKSLTSMNSTNKQILNYTGELENLQSIFNNPKHRGIWGEDQLNHILSNFLNPELFETQYTYKNGDIVDAIIRVGDSIIPIDAKFPLANYNKFLDASKKDDKLLKSNYETAFKKDLKNRINETSKYINASENTLNFAFMFIPAEGLYYDILNSKVGVDVNERNMMEYAREKKVSMISPLTIYPLIQITLQNSQHLQFNENIDKFKKAFNLFSKSMNAYTDLHIKLGKSLSASVNHYNNTSKKYTQMDKGVKQITSNESSLINDNQIFENVENPDLE